MAINGHLTGAGLGRLLVSGLKAGKPGAATGHAKSTALALCQAEDGGHRRAEAHTTHAAADAGNGAHPHSDNQANSSPVPGALFDGQRSFETQPPPAIEHAADQKPFAIQTASVGDSGGTTESAQPTAVVSRRILSADQTNFEAHAMRVGDVGGSGGTTPESKPLQPASRRNPSADQYKLENQSLRVGDNGDGTKIGAKPLDGSSRHHPISADHSVSETHTTAVGGGDDRAQLRRETQSSISPLIAELIQAARLRRRWHKAEKSLILQGRALCRAWTGGDKIAANGLFDRAAVGESNDPVILIALSPFLAAIEKFASERAAIEKDLRKLARQLPVWKDFAEGVKGLGELRLALVVGECGDIGSYRNPSCVWKRMGLAVIDGDRQRRKTDPEEALRNGYNAERRAMAYVLGTELIKAQLRAPKDEDGKRTDGDTMAIGAYGQIYLDRRAYETAREIPKAHAHNRAARYMVKRLFRDLYAAWRK